MSTDQSHYKTPDKLNARKALYKHVIGGSPWRQIVKNAVNGFDGMSILDAGCGSGEMLLLVTNGFKDVHAVGFDLSEGMIEEAKRHAREMQRKDVTFVVGDATAYASTETFDRVMILHVLHLVADPRATAKHLCSLLKKGGRAIITLHSNKDLPKLRSWNQWFEQNSGSKYTAGRETFTLEHDTNFLADIQGAIHRECIELTIRLTDPKPFIDYIDTTRERWKPTVTDAQWSMFLEHIRSNIQREIHAHGHFNEHSVTGLITVDA